MAPLKSVRILSPGTAELVFTRKEDAANIVAKYDGVKLDGASRTRAGRGEVGRGGAG